MRKILLPAMLALMAATGLAACSPGPGSGPGTGTPSATASTANGPATPSTGTPSADAQTTVPAPAPSAAAPTAGPGQGNAELAIAIKPAPGTQAVNYTLVCRNGLPAAESKHPAAAAACTALKNNAALLSPAPRPANQACTQQMGGPAEAEVTGSVDGIGVDAKFSLRDGCEIARWEAAKDVLGSTNGAV
jgi:hypothetical protein